LSISQEAILSPEHALLDAGLLKYPLILRKYREGDYFYPIGMPGKKKLSKFFKDQKYSMIEKENQWLLCSEGQIVWVIGQRVDARFAASTATENPLIIKCT
jgi:tRNA(Ile)-lysidine synthase